MEYEGVGCASLSLTFRKREEVGSEGRYLCIEKPVPNIIKGFENTVSFFGVKSSELKNALKCKRESFGVTV